MKSFDFKQQLSVGDKGEALIKSIYPSLEKSKDLKYDFLCTETGKKVEIKTDTYCIHRTPNFFMERWSDIARDKPGGPWRAAEDGVDTFIYLFIKNRTFFVFEDIPALVKRVDKLTHNQYMNEIQNRSWVTGGYRVNRLELKDLYTEHKG